MVFEGEWSWGLPGLHGGLASRAAALGLWGSSGRTLRGTEQPGLLGPEEECPGMWDFRFQTGTSWASGEKFVTVGPGLFTGE